VSDDRARPLGAVPARSTVFTDAFDAAATSFEKAEFDLAGAFLHFAEPSGRPNRGRHALLAARLERQHGDATACFDHGMLASKDHPESAGRLTGLALAAAAARRLARDDVADRLFARIRREAAADVRPETALAAYLAGTDAWARADYAAAEAAIVAHAALPQPDLGIRSLQGWIAVKRERYREAGARFAEALASPSPGFYSGVYERANTLHAALVIAAETADLPLGKRLRRAYESLPWKPSLARLKFLSLVNLRFLCLLEGDRKAAWFLAREATQIAPTPPHRIMAEIDAAVSSRLLGDDAACRLQFERAWQLVRAQRWGDATEEERVALSDFAAEAAREMPAEARQAITLYRSLRAKRAADSSLDDDVRVEAFTSLAFARVDEAMGDRASALERYRRALECYERIGLNLRIAIVAADLYRLTRDERYDALVKKTMGRAPKAWILTHPSLADALGPKARDVLARLLLGQSAKAAASELGRSTYTVTNHTRRIFEVFEVRSRDELRAKCAKLGITPATLRRP